MEINVKLQTKKGGAKIKEKTIQKWFPLENIYEDGIIKTKENKYVKIIQVIPINYNLKSDLEKDSILNSYKIFLKTCNFNIQILIQSNKEDLSKHISNIKINLEKKENNYLKDLYQNYLNYINNINSKKKSSSKKYYIIISKEESKENNLNFEIIINELKENYFKIKDCLSRCGNNVIEINSKEEIEKIYFSFFNTRKNININGIKI